VAVDLAMYTLYEDSTREPFHARGNVYIIDQLTTGRVNSEQRSTRDIDPLLGFH